MHEPKTLALVIMIAAVVVYWVGWTLIAIVCHNVNNNYWRSQKEFGKYASILK